MPRFVLLSRKAAPDASDLERIASEPGITILDHEVAEALLIEASEEAADHLRAALRGWIVSKETVHAPPDPPKAGARGADER